MRPAPVHAARAAVLLLAAASALVAGCTPKYIAEDRTDRRERELRIQQHAGGTHHATVVEGTRWLQTFGTELMVIDSTNGRELGRVEGVAFGDGGSLVDLVANADTAWAVSDRTALVEFDLSDNAAPVVAKTVSAEALGVEPMFVSRVGDELYVTGKGGAVRVSDMARFLAGQSPTHVVGSAVGPVACVGRRIHALSDGRYLGAATALVALPAGVGPAGGFAFLLQGQNGASVGLMSPTFAELSQSAIPSAVRRIRVLGDRLFAVTDRLLYAWRIDGSKLVDPEEIPLKGGRDIAMLRPNHYAVCGTFGRAMYRHKTEGGRIGDDFYNARREPGMLEVAVGDGRRILAGGREGFWLWRVGGEPELTNRTTDLTTIARDDLAAAWGGAHLVREKQADGSMAGVAVELRHDGASERYQPQGAPRIHSMELVDGDVWIGHDLGVDVLRYAVVPVDLDGDGRPDPVPPPGKAPAKPKGGPAGKAGAAASDADDPKAAPAGKVTPVATWRFEGPVLFIFPERIGGGASMVSLHGGFVLAKPVAVGDAPEFKGRGDVK